MFPTNRCFVPNLNFFGFMRIIFSLTNSRALILKMTIVFFKMLPKMTQMTIYDNSFLRLLSKTPKYNNFGPKFKDF